MVDSLSDFIDALPPGRPAIAYGGNTISVGELAAASRRVAAGLRRMSIGPGDRVALWLPNIPAWLECFFACARLGAIAVSVNTRFRTHEVEDILGRAGCRALVLWPGFKGIDFRGILAAARPEALAGVQRLIVYGEAADEPAFEWPGRTPVAYAALRDGAEDTAAPAPDYSRCVIFTTSGTTRAPKFVCHAQAGVVQHARDVAAGFGLDAPGARVLQALPLCGVFGFTQAMAALAGGAPMRMLPLFDAAEAAAALHDEHITHANGGDDMLDRLLAARPEPQPFPALRFFGYARFNPALEDLVARAGQRGVRACGLYGMSEVHALYALQPADLPAEERAKAGGVLVSPAAEVRICDPDSGAVLPPGEQGEIELKGPSLLREYYGDAAATQAAFHDGWFRTGDLGYLDGPRRFCFVSRIGDVLRLGGFLTSPQEIEAVLEAHPAVQGAQVVGATFGRTPAAVAYLVLRPGAVLDEAALHAWCQARLAGYKLPRRFVAIDAFPTTPSANGTKIQRARLRAMAAELAAELAAGAG